MPLETTQDIIIQKRKELEITLKEFSDALGLGKGGEKTIRAWENGEQIPSEEEFKKIKEFACIRPYLNNPENGTFTYIDLFAGIGGIRIPFQELGRNMCLFV